MYGHKLETSEARQVYVTKVEAGSPAAELFLTKCTTCHSWPHPKRHTAREWDHYLGLMEENMQRENIEFSQAEKETIRNYLYRNSR